MSIKNHNKNINKSPKEIDDYNKLLLEIDLKYNKLHNEIKSISNDIIEDLIKNIDNNFKKYDTFQGPQDENKKTVKENIEKYNKSNDLSISEIEIKGININTIEKVSKKRDEIVKLEIEKNEKEEKEEEIIKEKVNIVANINNINDLLELLDAYKIDKNVEYNINIEALHKIKQPLIKLNNMIGMKELKNNIVDQVLYFIQDLHVGGEGDFMHTVIYGSPGTGKTEIAKIMGEIYSKMGILKKGTFKKVTRSDLIAGYLGQTAIKTADVIQDCLGGVLFIDEAYALGNNEKRDSFSKECIDTLCESLSNYKDKLMVIIAGYENELKDCFFAYNQGLESRFTWRFKTDEYSGEDLYNIFLKKVKEINWQLESEINKKWFEKNIEYFAFYGRDLETLLSKTKIAHSKRIFCNDSSMKKIINLIDLNKGFEIFIKNEEVKNRIESKNRNKYLYSTMYH